MDLKNKKVLVMGMKASGISAGYLLKQNGAVVYCYDDSPDIVIENFTVITDCWEKYIEAIDLIIISPAIPNEHKVIVKAKELNIKIISEIELGSQFLECPIIAVTGTNGKTTVVSMITKLLGSLGYKVKAMGNIGYPVTQVVLDNQLLDYAIVETSSFQLEYIDKFIPFIAVVLNLAPDHMDRYDNYLQYINAKANIYKNQSSKDYIFVNKDDSVCRKFGMASKAKQIEISVHLKTTAVHIKDHYFCHDDISLCHVKECKLRGEHNKFNLLIALNIGAMLGAKREHLINLIKWYNLLPNRIEYVSTLNNINYYNDSKGTNIHACKNAIASMEGSVGLIMGGSDKKEDFCEFFENIDEKVKAIAVCGGNGEKIFQSALKMGFPDIKLVDSLKNAVEYLREKDIKNILFSPCSASFDNYRNYAERGDAFKKIIYEISI